MREYAFWVVDKYQDPLKVRIHKAGDRQEAVQYMLMVLNPNNCISKCLMYATLTHSDFCRDTAHRIMVLEFTKHISHKQHLLQIFANCHGSNDIVQQQWMKFTQFLGLILSDKYTTKQFFNTQNVLTPFISAIIKMLLFRPKHFKSYSDPQYNAVVLHLQNSIKYWKTKHFIIALDNRFCHLLCVFLTDRNIGNSKTMIYFWGVLTQTFIYYARKKDKKNQNNFICNMYKKEAKKLFAMTGCIETIPLPNRDFFLNAINGDSMGSSNREQMRLHNEDIVLKCDWIKCRKVLNTKSIKLCKRCKLVYYCSRNHQKKHWKYIHSQNCPCN
eukprot:8146_1